MTALACIYRIRNLVSGTYYVGSTGNFRRRKWEHLRSLSAGTHINVRLQRSWGRHGRDAFVFEVLEEVADPLHLARIEDTYLFKHYGDPLCCNYLMSSMESPSLDARVRAKISQTLRAKYAEAPWDHPRFDTTHTPDTKARISQNRRGKAAGAAHYRYGTTLSDAVKAKISAAQKGVKKAPRVYTEEGLAKARANMARHAQKPVPLEFAAVLEKFPAEVQARYDFSEAVYTGALSRITGIKCSAHGEFSQYSAQLRKGRGCPACGALIRGAKKKQDMLERWADPATREAMLEARK